ncbi:TonB-dependent receptor [Microbulbifer hainanensis]|uniref:TonB-dependent receptor n=1 Tax=Microbulbifer hainanensis TaxID=2735675 RepID=UPI001D014D77|nr:TonB-dependent receptor [Microbulbifer hainanensis]
MMHDADQSGNSRNFRLTFLSQAIAFATALSGSAYAAEIEEVVVTAQKRAENLQDVPIAISAFTGDNIKNMGAQNLTDLGKSTPGVEMNNDTTLQPTYNIRGIQTSDFTVGSDPAVAVYVDGVYTGRGAGAEVPLADIERVEVLKGPQGTLFGRNATGGAIHIITKKPINENQSEATFTAGNYGRMATDIIVNRALTDELSMRVSASSNKRDGYYPNGGNGADWGGQDTQTFRAALSWLPNEDTEILWRNEYNKLNQNSGTRASVNGALAPDGVFGDVTLDFPNREERDLYGSSLTVTHDFDDVTLTSITSYRTFDATIQQDEDGQANPDYFFGSRNVDDQKYFSQEFRLNGATDSLKWTLGASYSQEKLTHDTEAFFTPSTFESFALYTALKEDPEALMALTALLPAEMQGPVAAQLEPQLAAIAQMNDQQVSEQLPAAREMLRGFGLDGVMIASFFGNYMLPGLVAQAQTSPEAWAQFAGSFQCAPALADPAMLQGCLFQGANAFVQGQNANWRENVVNTGDYRSAAIYGDATWSITDALDLTFGLRYTQDEKDFSIDTAYQNSLYGIPFGIAFFSGGQSQISEKPSDSWSDLSGRMVLDYRWNDNVMTYLSWANGFKAGGFNSLNYGANIENSFDQENVTNIEAGIKSNLFDNRMQLNASVYSYQYDNLQELSLIGFPIPSYNLRNADAEGQGAEVEVLWAATDNLLIGGNYSHLETEYTRYQVIAAAGETAADDRTGQPRVGTPENKVNLMAEYTFDLASGASVVMRGDYNWTDERVGTITDPSLVIGDYDLLNARLAFNSASDRYTVSAWVQNVTDNEVVGSYGGPGSAIGSETGWRFMPRTYGADFTVRF